ncbi:MAG: hypothetical protein PHO66_04375, partial [Eubacteriales bacterium]|nr:hypothetical protein [Eubacteriales bacterium]
GPFLLGLWNRRAGKAAAWAGMLTGFGTAVVLNLLPRWGIWTAVDSPMAGVIAMIAGLVVTGIVSLLWPAKAFTRDQEAAAVQAEGIGG